VDRFASEATAYQNKVIEGALARVPGGTRISASEAKWPSGTVLGVPASPAQDELLTCLNSEPELVFCAFSAANYGGNWVAAAQAAGTNYWFPWGQYFPNQGTRSWYNQTSARVWREQFQNHGNELCISPWPYGNYTNSNYSGANLYDWWILMTTNESRC